MPVEQLQALWTRLLGMYGHTWSSQYGAAPTGEAAVTWRAALAGVSPAQLADGLRACVAEGREFPPSAPRFRAMCMGIPAEARVVLELRDLGSASPFSRFVFQHVPGFVDWHSFRGLQPRERERLIREAYHLAVEAVMRGEAIPEACTQPLPAPASVPRAEPKDPEVVLQRFGEMARLAAEEQQADD